MRTVPVGFTTGGIHRLGHKDTLSAHTLDWFTGLGADAVELMVHRTSSLGEFEAVSAAWLSGFRHVSVHGPTATQDDTAGLMACMRSFEARQDELSLATTVIHPSEHYEDGRFDFRFLEHSPGLRCSLENMDGRKDLCQDVPDMRRAFAAADAVLGRPLGFVLDLCHVYELDRTMVMADRLLDAFGDRLEEIHVSGYAGYHDPLCVTLQEAVVAAVPAGYPIVIESVFDERSQVQSELDWVRSRLAG